MNGFVSVVLVVLMSIVAYKADVDANVVVPLAIAFFALGVTMAGWVWNVSNEDRQKQSATLFKRIKELF